MPKRLEISFKFTITDLSNFDKWWSDAHHVSFLFYYYCTFTKLHFVSSLEWVKCFPKFTEMLTQTKIMIIIFLIFDIKISLIIKNLHFENFVSSNKQTKPSNHQLAQSVFFEDLTFWVGLHPKSQTCLDSSS